MILTDYERLLLNLEHRRPDPDDDGEWIEPAQTNTIRAETAVETLLAFLGDYPGRAGLRQTPARFVRFLEEWKRISDTRPSMTVFEEAYDEMVILDPVPFFSLCEHHVLPFFGTVRVGYIPNGRILGLSKFPRLIHYYACRLQVQERLVGQIADDLFATLDPLGLGVEIKARHLCMEMRGVRIHDTLTTTRALKGVFREEHVKAEFLSH